MRARGVVRAGKRLQVSMAVGLCQGENRELGEPNIKHNNRGGDYCSAEHKQQRTQGPA